MTHKLRSTLPVLVGSAFTLMLSGCANIATVTKDGEDAARSSLPELDVTWDQIQESAGNVQVGWIDALQDPVLSTLVNEAQANNKNLQAAAAGVESARAMARQAGAAATPSLGLSAGAQRGGTGDGGASSGLSLGLETQWEADVWGRIGSSRQAAIESLEAAEADYLFSQYSIAAGVARSYLIAIEAKQQEKITQKIVDALTELTRIVTVQADNGMASGQDVALAKSDLAAAKESQISAQGGQREALRALELLLGRYPEADVAVREALPAVPAPPPAGIPSEILERRPDLIAAERRIAAAFNSTNAAKAARLPRIGLSGSLGGSSTDLSNLLNPANVAWSVATSLVAPLIDGGLAKAQVDQATAEQDQAIAAYANAALTAFGEVETALDQGSLLAQREDALTVANTEALEALRIADLRFKEGETDLLEVLQIQQRVYGSESSLLTIQRSRLEQFLDLNLALGGDWKPVSP